MLMARSYARGFRTLGSNNHEILTEADLASAPANQSSSRLPSVSWPAAQTTNVLPLACGGDIPTFETPGGVIGSGTLFLDDG